MFLVTKYLHKSCSTVWSFLQKNSRKKMRYYLALLFVIYSNISFSQDLFTWQEKQYQHHFIDYNGDGLHDLLLQPLTENQQALIVVAELIDDEVKYLPANQQTLPNTVGSNFWSVDYAKLVVADFNGDGKQDLLFVFTELKEVQSYFSTENGLDFISSPPNHEYTETEIIWLEKADEFDFYPGDFNGDNKQGLLAVSLKGSEHYLMHSDYSNILFIGQTIKKNVKWGKNKTEKLLIKDINNDGKDDIFALANEQEKFHYQMLTDNTGYIGKAKKIKNKLKE